MKLKPIDTTNYKSNRQLVEDTKKETKAIFNLLIFIYFITGLTLGFVIYTTTELNQHIQDSANHCTLKQTEIKIDLPEEYKLIDKYTPLQGYYDKDSILHIEFNHKYK